MGVLTEDDIRFFKREGYLIKQGAMDSDLCARARERLWDDPPQSMTKDDPESWVGPIKPDEESDDSENLKRGFGWRYRRLGREPWMADMLPRSEFVRSAAEQLLGKDRFILPERVRGIYCTLPQAGDAERKPRHLHVDAHPFNFAIVGYIDDVYPDGGGFTIWPTSHCKFFFDYHSRYANEPAPQFQADRDEFLSDESNSFQTFGGPGDIVFWHHRIGHMASVNYTKQIRKAVLCDFRLHDMPRLQEQPPGDDIWVDWSDEMRAVSID